MELDGQAVFKIDCATSGHFNCSLVVLALLLHNRPVTLQTGPQKDHHELFHLNKVIWDSVESKPQEERNIFAP
jgi:hypothetical protein